jgi:hypothetical protein
LEAGVPSASTRCESGARAAAPAPTQPVGSRDGDKGAYVGVVAVVVELVVVELVVVELVVVELVVVEVVVVAPVVVVPVSPARAAATPRAAATTPEASSKIPRRITTV